MNILLASNNAHKIEEYNNILKDFDVKIYSLKDLNITSDPEESGKTFKENSLIKAKALIDKTDMAIIADDSGLMIDELPNILGVNTARFLGKDTSYEIKRQEIINRLEGKSNRKAHFTCCITLIIQGDIIQFEGICKGNIAFESLGSNGFGYDPIFIPNNYDITFSQMSDEQKNKISHRALAANKLREYLKNNWRTL